MRRERLRGGIALVAEDHEVYRMGLARILRDGCGFISVVEAVSYSEIIECIRTTPDLILATISLGMPGLHGLGEIQTIKRLHSNLLLAVVTGSHDRHGILASMAIGVHAHIPKTFGPSRIAAALNMVLDGVVFVPWSLTELEEDPRMAEAERSPAKGTFTSRQMDVLTLLRLGSSNKEIARALRLSESTVKVHVNAIFKVLGVNNRTNAATASIG